MSLGVYQFSVASLAMRGLPRWKLGLAVAVVFGSLAGLWLLEILKVDRVGGGLPDSVPHVDPAFGFLVAVAVLMISVWIRFIERGRAVALAFCFYIAITLGGVAVYCLLFLNRSVWDLNAAATRPDSDLPISSFSPGSGVPNCFLVLGIATVLLLASTYPQRWYQSPTKWISGSVAVIAVLLGAIGVLTDGSQRWADVMLAVSTGGLMYSLIVVLPFAVRSPKYTRVMTDVVCGAVAYHLILFFYAPDHPALLLSGGFAVLAFIFACLVVTHPRRFQRPEIEIPA